ncbi:MAG: hypothetical protein RLZZ301_900 [Bacteroidota bacterium]|jgi:hypothetical protein
MKIGVLVSFLVLFSCSKVTKQEKRLYGSWKVLQFRIEDGEGFTFYDSLSNGIFEFEPQQINASNVASYNYFGQQLISDSIGFSAASFYWSTDATHLFVPRSTDTLDLRILHLTNTALEIEYYDPIQYRLRRFNCQKIY